VIEAGENVRSVRLIAGDLLALQFLRRAVVVMFGLNIHRYGPKREFLAKNLSAVTPGRVQQVVRKYLSQTNCTVCFI
jgi:hypothetical protein